MKFSDETLMAYADGELDAATRAGIEAEIARDPEVARAVERHRALASRLRGAWDDVLAEPVPERLAALVAKSGAAPVADFAERRQSQGTRPGWRLPLWAAAAASLAIGLFVGMFLARGPALPYAQAGGALVARGALEQALSSQLAAMPGDSEIDIGISFRNRDGAYCRTFRMSRGAPASGLACRSAQDWAIEVLAAAPAVQGELRPAAAMPIAVLQAVDVQIDGAPLDAAAEAAARDAGWR